MIQPVQAQETTEEAIAKNKCATELSNLAVVNMVCEGWNLAVNGLIKDEFELKVADAGILFMTK